MVSIGIKEGYFGLAKSMFAACMFGLVFVIFTTGSAFAVEEFDLWDKEIQRYDRKISKFKAKMEAEKHRADTTTHPAIRKYAQKQVRKHREKIAELKEIRSVYKKEAKHHAQLQRQGWRLKYRDEFSGESIINEKWSHEVNCWGGGNNEKQCYTDRDENSYVDGGLLHIVAKEEVFSGPGLPDDDPSYNPEDTSVTLPYTSARLRSKDKVDFRYGRIEVRAKVAGGQGMWPAIWMLPTDYVYGGWPSSGEIDIFESVNLGVWANEIHGTLHYGLKWPQWENHGKTLPLEFNPADDFHVYSVEWEEDEIRWYFNGEHYQTQRAEGWYNYIWQGQDKGFSVANPKAPFDQNFHIILNLAAGGDWPGNPDTGWIEDRKMLVDYVRVYQCSQNYESGAGCENRDDNIAVNEDAGAPGENRYELLADGPATLELMSGGEPVENTLSPGFWELNEGSLTQTFTDIGGDKGVVWDVSFSGLGNVFLSSQDMSDNPGFDSGFDLAGGSGWTNNGELAFDILVDSASDDSRFTVKLDSGWPNQGQVDIEIPETGRWTKVAVRISDLIANPNPSGGGVDISALMNPFVLEYEGSFASIKIDNVRLQCAFNTEPESWQLDQTCELAPKVASVVPSGDTHDVFVDSVTDWEPFDCCGGASIAQVDDAGNGVLEFTYDSDPNTNTVTFFGLATKRDLTHYSGGTLEFDMLVSQQPSNPAAMPWLIKVDCGSGCSTGDLPITISSEGTHPPTGVWQHYTLDVDDLVSRGLDLANVSAIVIWPAWGNQDEAVYRLDNIQWKVASTPSTGPRQITFNVDMSAETLAPTDVVYVSGAWDGWCGGCNPLSSNNDGTWSGTFTLAPGVYRYKFQINEWAAQENVPPEPNCGVSEFGFTNREVLVESADINLATTPYGGCPGGITPPPALDLPAEAAPQPTDAPASVLSLFSDVYTDLEGINFNPFWGQSTVTTQMEISGDSVLKYANFNYQGTDFAGTPQNVSGYTSVHIDFWTADSTALNFYLISPGPSEKPYTLPITQGEWVSIDIPLSHFADVVDLTNLIQLKMDGNGTIFIDNIYFR